MVAYNPAPVETARDLPSFCPDCGRKLVPFEVTAGFRASDGAPILRAAVECRGSWIDRLFGLQHPRGSFVVSPRPQVVPTPPPPRRV